MERATITLTADLSETEALFDELLRDPERLPQELFDAVERGDELFEYEVSLRDGALVVTVTPGDILSRAVEIARIET